MCKRSLAILLVEIAAAGLHLMAGQLPPVGSKVVVKVTVPVTSSQIGEVRLGGQRCKVLGVASSKNSAVIIVIDPDVRSMEIEDDQFNELRAFLSRVRPDVEIEVWSDLGFGRHELAAPFAQGWVNILRTEPVAAIPYRNNLTSDHAEIMELVARRFAGRGPVRLFLLDTFFSLDARELDTVYSSAYNETRIEPFWPHVGDSGLIVYPIMFLKRAKRPKHPVRRKTFSSGLFGTDEIIAGGIPGLALAQAFAESEASTVVTIEVPARKYTWKRRAPKLQVYSRDGKKQFERPFVAGGEAVDEVEATAQLSNSLSRMVPPLIVQRAGIVRSCGGQSAESSEDQYIGLEGVTFPGSQPPLAKVFVTTKPHGQAKLTVRGRETTLLRQGNSACLGPLPVTQDSDVFIYCPETPWLAAVRVGGR